MFSLSNFIIPGVQSKKLEIILDALSQPYFESFSRIILILPSKYNPNPTTSYQALQLVKATMISQLDY